MMMLYLRLEISCMCFTTRKKETNRSKTNRHETKRHQTTRREHETIRTRTLTRNEPQKKTDTKANTKRSRAQQIISNANWIEARREDEIEHDLNLVELEAGLDLRRGARQVRMSTRGAAGTGRGAAS